MLTSGYHESFGKMDTVCIVKKVVRKEHQKGREIHPSTNPGNDYLILSVCHERSNGNFLVKQEILTGLGLFPVLQNSQPWFVE